MFFVPSEGWALSLPLFVPGSTQTTTSVAWKSATLVALKSVTLVQPKVNFVGSTQKPVTSVALKVSYVTFTQSWQYLWQSNTQISYIGDMHQEWIVGKRDFWLACCEVSRTKVRMCVFYFV